MNDPDRTTTTLTWYDARTVLRAMPYGGVDESTRSLPMPPAVLATVSPVIVAIRWAAVMYGIVYAAFKVASERNLEVVYALIVVLFLASWRTVRPIRLASRRHRDIVLAFTDAILVGAAVGISGGFDSPFIFAVLACAAVVAFGWGIRAGCLNLAIGLGAVLVVYPVASQGLVSAPDQAFALGLLLVLAVVLAGILHNRLIDAELRRESLSGRVSLLSEANDLLHLLNQVARTLPESLDMREAMSRTNAEIQRAFHADAVAVIVYDDLNDEWVPQIAEGCALRPSSTAQGLPLGLRRAIEAKRPVLIPDFDAIRPRAQRSAPRPRPQVEVEGAAEEAAGDAESELEDPNAEVDPSDRLTVIDLTDATGGDGQGSHVGVGARTRCGLYSAVRARGQLVGAIAIEHRHAGHYTERDSRIIEGLGDVLALTVDNARSFGRLRNLGAEEERSRIARDLHDRLGQWLSYISFELERIITSSEEGSEELDRLYSDVQTAIDELRETLRQLRLGVTAERSLAVVAGDLVGRFNQRGEAVAYLHVTAPDQHLPVRVENELLRVLQEGLSNVAKHARADTVEVTWDVDDRQGTLTISDDGRGFDAAKGVRDSAYGLVGMHEHADMVGARLSIESAPGIGTTVTVVAGRSDHGPADGRRADDAGLEAAPDGLARDDEGHDDDYDERYGAGRAGGPGMASPARSSRARSGIESEDGVTAG